MHPADEYARLRAEIRHLESRARELRQAFLRNAAPHASNAHRVVIRQQTRRVFCHDRLPTAIRDDPRLWREATSPIVSVEPIAPRDEEELVLIEPF